MLLQRAAQGTTQNLCVEAAAVFAERIAEGDLKNDFEKLALSWIHKNVCGHRQQLYAAIHLLSIRLSESRRRIKVHIENNRLLLSMLQLF
jgi:hypothetical protein